MKKNALKRCAAVFAACTVMAAAMPTVPFNGIAAENLISNSTFETGTTDWGTYLESGGVATLGTENGKLALHITDQSEINYGVQMFYDIVPLYQNGVYRLTYEISSTVPRFVESMIQMNGGDYRAYTWKGVNVTTEPQTIDYEFVMEDETDIMTKFCFNCGLQEKQDGGPVGEHTIYLDNVSLELIDDSNVDYSASKPYAPSIITNQVGYRPNAKKTAVFRDTEGGSFSVVNAETNDVVFTGEMQGPTTNTSAGETNFTGDFSSVTTSGKYIVKADGLDDSYVFEIGENVYNNLLDESVRMLYLQRCGTQIEDEKFGHSSCHDTIATIYQTNDQIDVNGGWHDAGDYGRYIVAAAKAVADLMYAYQANPDMYSDNIGIPESGNSTPDILDEVRYELEWMLKMQDKTDGGVYHKVSCATFPGYVMPNEETKPLIVMPKSATATADFAASMAMAYEFYKDIDAEFSNKCLEAAKQAFLWAKNNPNELYLKNPADITTGAYEDKSAADELYWAAAQLYRATGDSSYLDGVSVKKGLDWSTVGDYGNIAIVTMEGVDKTSEAYTNAAAAIKDQADSFLKLANLNPYGSALVKYAWGSNMTLANTGIIMGLAYELTGDAAYLEGANKQLDYLLGLNPNGASFVTGYGTVSPKNPHHRPSMAVGEAMPGMLVGGVNSALEDSAAKAYCKGEPPAKCWIDNAESYSTNEITIYWNSPLTYLLSLTGENAKPPVDDIIWGDANGDGKVTMADATAVLQSIGNNEKYGLSEEETIRADVNNHGDGLTGLDALAIQRYDAKLIDKLPESYQEDTE